jgi:hypothetical protein
MIKARMRSGASWHDVCILNLSLHGAGIQAPNPPARGSYVETRRGSHVLIARVAWSKGHRAGLRSQDPIFIQSRIAEPSAAAPPKAPNLAVERRRAPPTVRQRHDHSRLLGRTMEFVCFVIAAGAVALGAFGTVEQALARPLSQISAALGGS